MGLTKAAIIDHGVDCSLFWVSGLTDILFCIVADLKVQVLVMYGIMCYF
jgi:hypothetical protein